MKKSARNDKKEFINILAGQAEEAANTGNLRELYMTTRKLTGEFQQSDKPVRDKQGNVLTASEEQLSRWSEHFQELLNRPAPDSTP